MALRPDLILIGAQNAVQANQPFQSLIGGFQTGQDIRAKMEAMELARAQEAVRAQQAPIKQQILEQQAQAGRMSLDQAKKEEVRNGLFKLASDASVLPKDKQAQYFRDNAEQFGPLAAEIVDSSDQEILETIPRLVQTSRAASGDSFQFGSTQMFKDSEGQLFFGTQRRNPATGETVSDLSPIGHTNAPKGKVTQTGTYGLTAEEKIGQISKEKGAEEKAKLVAQQRQEYVSQGLAARSMIPKTKKLLELNEAINTGKIAKAKKFMSDIFGVTDPDLGQFNSLAGSLVLENIRALGANPTEGERAFLQQITPSLDQGGEVNRALLTDMLEIQNRQVERAKWFSRNPDKTVEDYLLETDTEDFEPTGSSEEFSSTNQEFDQSLLEFMTPEERALFDGS